MRPRRSRLDFRTAPRRTIRRGGRGDVLEYLRDPWAVLRSIAAMLEPDGAIVASIPHLGYNGVIASLLTGEFEYQDVGLLDRTHSRFFGVRNIQRLFNDCGFKIVECDFVVLSPDDSEFADRWEHLSADFQKKLAANRLGSVYQVVVKAKLDPEPASGLDLMAILSAASEVSQTTEVRSHTPDRATGAGAASPVALPESPRLIAFYLPQFHPIPENDAWWGKGFTEWSNVTKASRTSLDTTSRICPADLGFYDLRVRESRRQAELARQYGIHGFCYYYYWFAGKTPAPPAARPCSRDRGADLPFCLCWANENWTRAGTAPDARS